jgi:xanthine dehydrogenase accessory factor
MDVLAEIGELTRRGQAFALATVVWRQPPSSSQPGARAIITADGELRGWIGGACAEPVVIREAQRVIAEGTARLLLLGTPDQFGGAVPDGMTVIPISCQSEGALEIYIEPVLPVPHLVIVGSSPMAGVLAALAGALGWRADRVDGPDFATDMANERSMIVVATQGHDDEDVLARAVAARPAYLGLVGSRRRGATVLGYLADRGVPKKELDRVRVPAGLDLGKTTHQEIAVAILAELVQLRASGALSRPPAASSASAAASSASASASTAASAASAAASAASAAASAASSAASAAASAASSAAASSAKPGLLGVTAQNDLAPAARAEAVDPVCGMTVATASSRPLRHYGADYYFCCAGCRQAFEQNPDAYIKKETRC